MRILLALDFSSLTSALVAQVQGLAGDSAGSGHTVEVFVLHVAAPDPDFVGYEAGPQSVRDQRANELREEHRELEALAERLTGGSIAPMLTHLLDGKRLSRRELDRLRKLLEAEDPEDTADG